MRFLLIVSALFILSISSSHALFNNLGKFSLNLGGKTSKKVEKKPRLPDIVINPSYNVAAGFGAVGIASIASDNLLLGIPVALIGALLTVQTGRVRFLFDDTSMEVLIDSKKKDNKQLEKSGENAFVGGANRWTYDSFTRYKFFPSKDIPIFLAFWELQTNPEKEQFHLFPVIMDGKQLNTVLLERVGAK